MLGGIIQGGEELVDVFIILCYILVLYVYCADVSIQGFQMLTDMC